MLYKYMKEIEKSLKKITVELNSIAGYKLETEYRAQKPFVGPGTFLFSAQQLVGVN